MSLFHQIAIKISAIFILLLVALMFNQTQQSSSFIQGQMQTTANDMATALGITLANGLDVNDKAAVDTLFNSVFDSGYYSRIELIGPGGDILAEKERKIQVSGVPAWFTDTVPFSPAVGSTQVMRGWTPIGELRLTLHPGYAYAQLYDASQWMLFWVGGIGFISLVVLWLLLRWLLRPLHKVKLQADAIMQNDFIRQEPLPHTRELRQVAGAMNRMVDKVKSIFIEQSETLKRYHNLLYIDDLTGFGNRRYLTIKLSEVVKDETIDRGIFSLIAVSGLEELRNHSGYKAVHEHLKQLAQLIDDNLPQESDAITCITSENEFAIYLNCDSSTAENYMAEVFTQFNEYTANASLYLNAGIISIDAADNVNQIMSMADYALTQAKSRGANHYHFHRDDNLSVPLGKMEWKNWLETSFKEQRFFLVAQDVLSSSEEIMHRELYIRLNDEDGNTVPAKHFMPIASSLGMEKYIDREVFRLILDKASSHESIALNLSQSVLDSADALAEFEAFIRDVKRRGDIKLAVEISHFSLIKSLEVASHVSEFIREAGFKFGIDRFDLGSDLELVGSIRPNYIKIDAHQLDDITSEHSLNAFHPLQTLASSLEIQLIAVAIDSDELLQRLRQLGQLGLQGNQLSASRDF